MKYNPDIHHRKSIRLKDYDYTQPGAYFVTLITQERINLFGDISHGVMLLNAPGEIINLCWQRLPDCFPIRQDEEVIMPNHMHGIIWILDHGTGEAFTQINSESMKYRGVNASLRQIWQRNYYEHIIRNQKELDAIREYIYDKPRRWTEDKEYRE